MTSELTASELSLLKIESDDSLSKNLKRQASASFLTPRVQTAGGGSGAGSRSSAVRIEESSGAVADNCCSGQQRRKTLSQSRRLWADFDICNLEAKLWVHASYLASARHIPVPPRTRRSGFYTSIPSTVIPLFQLYCKILATS